MSDTKYPHGECECPGSSGGVEAGHCGPGPAAFLVERNGVELRLCTRCDLPGDEQKRLLVTREDNATVYSEYDALGFVCIVIQMATESSAHTSEGHA